MGLAQQKVKQRIPIDPRNTAWTNDKEKVGQKLMERMGWVSGQGLGADGQGMTASLTATLKEDNKGKRDRDGVVLYDFYILTHTRLRHWLWTEQCRRVGAARGRL